MKKIKRWLKEIFNPEQDIDITAIGQALNDPEVRGRWLANHLDDIRMMNLEVDRRLLNGTDFKLTDLCARRKAYKDVLEAILSARRSNAQAKYHNPKDEMEFINLDRVTV